MKDLLIEIAETFSNGTHGTFSEAIQGRISKRVFDFLVLSFWMNFQRYSEEYMNDSMDFPK